LPILTYLTAPLSWAACSSPATLNLLAEGVTRQRSGAIFAGVVYAHQLRVSIGQCVADLELVAKAGKEDEWINRIEYLPLK